MFNFIKKLFSKKIKSGTPFLKHIEGDVEYNGYWNEEGVRIFHCETDYAVIQGSRKLWYVHGKLHRLDGPAVIDDNHEVWIVDEEDVTEQVVKLYKDGYITKKWQDWTEEDVALFSVLLVK